MHSPRSLRRLGAQALLALAGVAGCAAAGAANLNVDVADGPAGTAQLYVALFDSAPAYDAGKAVANQMLPLREGRAQLVFKGLPAGRYALKLFADENGNATMDRNLVGIPTERYGFSKDARSAKGAPGFDEAAVPLDGDADITVHLR